VTLLEFHRIKGGIYRILNEKEHGKYRAGVNDRRGTRNGKTWRTDLEIVHCFVHDLSIFHVTHSLLATSLSSIPRIQNLINEELDFVILP